MKVNESYLGGVIAVKQTRLLKEKINRFCELSLADAFRQLLESGFGGGEICESAKDYEILVKGDSLDIDNFIREYAPNVAIKSYLLSSRDFHNALVLIKNKVAPQDVEKMFTQSGLISIDTLKSCFESNNFDVLPTALKDTILRANDLIEGKFEPYELGEIFTKGLYEFLLGTTKLNFTLNAIIKKKIDMLNVLAVFRASNFERFEKSYIKSKIACQELWDIREGKICEKMADFVDVCRMGIQRKNFMQAENIIASYEFKELDKRKYELKTNEPFLYYILCRRQENENVRIVFACLNAGLNERQIKARLRG